MVALLSTTPCCIDEKRKLIWKFKIKNEIKEGALVYNNILYRVIKLSNAK